MSTKTNRLKRRLAIAQQQRCTEAWARWQFTHLQQRITALEVANQWLKQQLAARKA